MLYFVTVHHRTDRWAAIQRRYLDAWMTEPFSLVACVEGVSAEAQKHFDEVVQGIGRHAGKLNLLAHIISGTCDPEDVLVFMDSDAFPVADPVPLIREGLSQSSLVAVQRLENLGDRQPHPCFAACTARTWLHLRGDWSNGHPWLNAADEMVSDVGGNMLRKLSDAGLDWTPVTRTHSLDDHPVLFGVYGGVIYHHGAGSRSGLTRSDLEALPFRGSGAWLTPPVRPLAHRLARKIAKDRIGAKVDGWYEAIATTAPEDFTVRFLENPPP